MFKLTLGLASLFAVFSLSGCGVQDIPRAKNDVEAKVSEVTNQYKRRSDLIPNLVETVKGFAKQEKEVLVQVTEARAKATSINVDPTKLTSDQLQKMGQSQGELSQALGRLMVVAEKYPELKSDQNFRDLQAQLEGTENRIAVSRNRMIESIQGFNNLITVFPTSLTNSIVYHYEKLPQYTEGNAEALKTAPEVKF